jgi:hypothetical protein
MAVLNATGITFGGVGGSLNSRYGIIPQSTPMLFIRSTAPTGWTQVTTQNDKTLRVVNNNTTGGTAGGTNAFANTFTTVPVSATVPVSINSFATGNTVLDVNTIPPHSHSINAGGNVATGTGGNPGSGPASTTGNYGNSGAHAHGITFTSASGPGATSFDFRVQYVDVIICTFN